jgi:hypothetical protein
MGKDERCDAIEYLGDRVVDALEGLTLVVRGMRESIDGALERSGLERASNRPCHPDRGHLGERSDVPGDAAELALGAFDTPQETKPQRTAGHGKVRCLHAAVGHVFELAGGGGIEWCPGCGSYRYLPSNAEQRARFLETRHDEWQPPWGPR